MQTMGNGWLWGIFAAIVLVMLAVDLLIFKGGERHRVSLKEAAGWSIAWVSVAVLFGIGLWVYLALTVGRDIANDTALKFFAGYVVEKSLAVDNVFVWMMIFSYFCVPLELQRRVLLYGILGAVFLRTIMILMGSWIISDFHWILYVFGVFLVFTGIKMVRSAEQSEDLEQNPLLKWMRNRFPITPQMVGERFFVVQDGMRMVTPLFLALVLVEISDMIFAVDSIPTVFAITTDPFIVLTSNLFAILGLRAMYFLLADVGDRFSLLKYGLAMILVFIGVKMLVVDWIKVPVWLSLSVIASILTISVVASLIRARKREWLS
ncbi:TerC family protein [Vreelandella olivaria]|uniref:TerC family protein n=1 Tax=Vreelandella olivaria TaxID=390919 RepID=UPI00201E8CDC|nr:TerC family protein [Halomonas olivaria]